MIRTVTRDLSWREPQSVREALTIQNVARNRDPGFLSGPGFLSHGAPGKPGPD